TVIQSKFGVFKAFKIFKFVFKLTFKSLIKVLLTNKSVNAILLLTFTLVTEVKETSKTVSSTKSSIPVKSATPVLFKSTEFTCFILAVGT
ncbi:hypothetical protein, partial [Agrococcus terreus]|uniref:hypothetical protein n=1 Tax=Agrococcus terreus TaxID=574649 RepID=UPI0031D18755